MSQVDSPASVLENRSALQDKSAMRGSMRELIRQPILDGHQNIYGYELDFSSELRSGSYVDEELITRNVIDTCLMLAPEQDGEVTFINCSRNALLSQIVTLLPPSSTVLQIQERVEPDDELVACCISLKAKGYRFAIGMSDTNEERHIDLSLVEFITVDFAFLDKDDQNSICEVAKSASVKLIAKNINTPADYETARSAGCTFFEGYYFCSPVTIGTKVIPQNQIVYLRLLAALTQIPANLNEIERLVMSDTSICYRLLRLVNSVLYAPPSPISSIRSAVMMIGDDEFRKLVTVAMATGAASAQSRVAIRVALERARFCELLAPVMHESASALYLLGMLSLIDVILSRPMQQTMDLLPLDPKIKNALLGEQNSLSVALDLVRSHELADWPKAEAIQSQLGLSASSASLFYLESVQWATRANRISSTQR